MSHTFSLLRITAVTGCSQTGTKALRHRPVPGPYSAQQPFLFQLPRIIHAALVFAPAFPT